MLEGKLIKLRAIEPKDINTLLLWENDFKNWNVSETLAPFSRYILTEYLKQSQDFFANKQIRLIIEELQSGESIGLLDLFDYNPKNRRAGLGILVDKKYRKNGYATESIELSIKYSKYLNLHQLYCSVGVENKKSIRLFKKLNFSVMGIKRDWQYINGTWKDEIDFQHIIK